MKNQSAFRNPRALIGLFIMLCGAFLALLGFGAFPAPQAVDAKPQRKPSAHKNEPTARLSTSQPARLSAVPPELICEDDGICTQTYANFDSDLGKFLARRDNTIRLTDARKKSNLINTMKNFAGTVGIPRQAIRQQGGGRWYGRTLVNGEIDAYYKQDSEPELRSSAVVKARKTTRFRTAVAPLSDDLLKQIADGTLAQWHLPILTGDTFTFASNIRSRVVDDDTTDHREITARVGYYRSFMGRQVINSSIKVEIDPSTSLTSGISLRAFWPVLPPQATTLKTFDTLKSDVLKALHKNGSKSLTLNIGSCMPSYYQAPGVLIPSITCTGAFIDRATGLPDNSAQGVSVDVSLASAYSLDEADEMSVYTSTYPDDSDTGGIKPGPDSCSETSGFAFHAYYTTDEDRFYDGAKEFYDEFDTSSRAANLGKAWHDSRFVDTPCDQYGADWSDLIYVESHGQIRHFVGENADIFVTAEDSVYEVDNNTELGNGDVEYFFHPGCLMGSPLYCYERSAVSRYTEQTYFHSVFHGLHVFSAENGISYSSSHKAKKLARILSEYLNDGETIVEAWDDSNDDVAVWLSSFFIKGACVEVLDPDYYGCEKQVDSDCSRWTLYASSFYQDGKQYVTLNNRSSYSDDVFPGDPDYDIDLRYETQTETVPTFSEGYSLP